jgi:hypothetical protein
VFLYCLVMNSIVGIVLYCLVVLGGVMVSVLAIGPKVRRFKPGFLRRVSKATCKILRHVKDTYEI